jgi:hypothetical protein
MLPTNLQSNTNNRSINHGSNHSSISTSTSRHDNNILIADPNVMITQLLQAMQQDTHSEEDKEKMANQLHHAMNKLLQMATGVSNNNNIITSSYGNATDSNQGNTTETRMEQTEARVDQLQKQIQEMNMRQQLLLDFQNEYLEAKIKYEQQLEQHAQRSQQQSEMIQQQQQQILQLIQKMDQQQLLLLLLQPTDLKKEQQEKSADKQEDAEMLGRLAALEVLEASLRDMDWYKVQSQSQLQLPTQRVAASFVQHNNYGSIDTEDVDENATDGHLSQPEISQIKSSTGEASKASAPGAQSSVELVEMWICSSCGFEHEAAGLHFYFCGVCGASSPEKRKVTADCYNSGSHLQEPEFTSMETKRFGSPPMVIEPLSELQRHTELQENSPIETPPRSPMRQRNYKSSKSTTDVNILTTPKRNRPHKPPTANFQMERQQDRQDLNATYHGQTSHGRNAAASNGRVRVDHVDLEGSLGIKCLDNDNRRSPAVYDIDMINQQLTTFDSAPVAPVGSARTDTAPKTPKINKRQNLRRSMSVQGIPENPTLSSAPTPLASSGFGLHKPALVVKAIPRRTKSNSTEQLRMHQLQQDGGAKGPPSPTQKRTMLGAAVSALHKSPKKALSALKILGGKDFGKGKINSFILDDDGGDTEDEKERYSRGDRLHDTHPKSESARPARRASSENRAGASLVLTSSNGWTDPTSEPATPGRQTSLENRTRATLVLKASNGWNKWFTSGSNQQPSVLPAKEEQEDLDIDDSVCDTEDEDLLDRPEESEEEYAKTRRRRRCRQRQNHRLVKPTEQSISFARRVRFNDEREHKKRLRRSKSWGTEELGQPLPTKESSGSNNEKRKQRLRRSISLGAQELRKPSPAQKLRSNDINGIVLEEDGGKARHQQPSNSFAQPSAQLNRGEAQSDVYELWEKKDCVESVHIKSELLKQRVQGLRKGTIEAAASAAQPHTSKNAKAIAASEDLSESTDGCTIYLGNSIGDMSGVTFGDWAHH